jgi:hypothetical protein
VSAVGGHGERGISERRVFAAEDWVMKGYWAGVLGVLTWVQGWEIGLEKMTLYHMVFKDIIIW